MAQRCFPYGADGVPATGAVETESTFKRCDRSSRGMGLRSWVGGLFAAGTADANPEDDPELSVDVERRAGSIMEHYGFSGEKARRIAEILAAELAREEGYARTMIADRIGRELDVDEDRARTVVDTEVTSIRNLARVREFARQGSGGVRFRWVDPHDRDESPVCADIRAAIDDQGAVTLEELEALIREAAAAHDEGTPDRAADLIPHEGCRHTVVRHVA